MRTVTASWRTLAAGAALAGALAPAVWAAPAAPSTPDKDKAAPAVEKIRKALDAPITLKLERQSLTAAVDVLRDKTKLNFVLDTFTLQQFGIIPDQPPTPVDVDLKDVKLKSALRTILQPYGLSYAPIGDTILITNEQTAMVRQMKQRVNIECDKVEFGQALKQLSRETAVNLILDSRVEKEAKSAVSLELEDVPLETAVRLLSEMAGLKPVRVGNVLFITDKKNANEMRNDPDLGGMTQPPQGMPGQDFVNFGPGGGFGGGGGVFVGPGGQIIQLPGGGGVAPGAGGLNPPDVKPAVPPADDPKEKTGEAKDDAGKEKKEPVKEEKKDK
jgi:hypothetical protein